MAVLCLVSGCSGKRDESLRGEWGRHLHSTPTTSFWSSVVRRHQQACPQAVVARILLRCVPSSLRLGGSSPFLSRTLITRGTVIGM
jgi:hypothetical protein